jgi:predicted ABC-type ATPase
MEVYDDLRKGKRKSSNPKAILFCGASGVGKTTIRQTFLTKNMIVFDADELWEKYKLRNIGSILRESIHSAINDKYTILYDGTCRNHAQTMEILDHLKENKYTITIVIVYSRPLTALQRVKERKSQKVPLDVAKQIFGEVSKHIKEFMDYPADIYLYTNETEPLLIFKKTSKKIHCISPESEFYFY